MLAALALALACCAFINWTHVLPDSSLSVNCECSECLSCNCALTLTQILQVNTGTVWCVCQVLKNKSSACTNRKWYHTRDVTHESNMSYTYNNQTSHRDTGMFVALTFCLMLSTCGQLSHFRWAMHCGRWCLSTTHTKRNIILIFTLSVRAAVLLSPLCLYEDSTLNKFVQFSSDINTSTPQWRAALYVDLAAILDVAGLRCK